MQEKKLLAAICQDRETFEALDYDLQEEDLGAEGMRIKDHVREFYSRDPQAHHVDFDLLSDSVAQSLASPKHRELFDRIIRDLERMDVSALNVRHALVESKQRAIADSLTIALSQMDQESIRELMREYERLGELEDADHAHEFYHGYSIRELLENEQSDDNRIMLAPSSLNDRLKGGVRRGQSAVVIARPETGKTAYAVTAIWGFLAQGLKVLYLGNEDPMAEILTRVASAISGMTESEMKKDPDRAQQLVDAGGYGNLILKGIEPGSVQEITALVKRHEPDVLIIDQLRHIKTGDDSKVQSLEAAAVAGRVLAKKYDLFHLGFTQAGESAADSLRVVMEDLADNKTGVQGACDLFIGIGVNDSYKNAGMRTLTLSKNKIGHVHDSFNVRINESLSRYENE